MIALMGGAFDPVHFGHIRALLKVLSYEEVSKACLIPCAAHSDKGEACAGAEDRLAMLRLLERTDVHVDSREIDRGGVSHTVDTMLEIRREVGPDVALACIVGQDVSDTIHTWKQAEALPQLANLIIFSRTDHASRPPLLWSEVDSIRELSRFPAGRCVYMRNKPVDISSTAIRKMLARREQPRHMLPGGIWNYIRRHRLYGWKDDAV